MVMPLMPSTLEHLPILDSDALIKLWKQMQAAAKSFHDAGLVYMDFKPSNICINIDGDFVLADVGSVVPSGNYSESTVPFLPQELLEEMNKSCKLSPLSSPSVDWWMLATTLLSKWDPKCTEGFKNLSMSKILGLLEEKLSCDKRIFFVFEELKENLEKDAVISFCFIVCDFSYKMIPSFIKWRVE